MGLAWKYDNATLIRYCSSSQLFSEYVVSRYERSRLKGCDGFNCAREPCTGVFLQYGSRATCRRYKLRTLVASCRDTAGISPETSKGKCCACHLGEALTASVSCVVSRSVMAVRSLTLHAMGFYPCTRPKLHASGRARGSAGRCTPEWRTGDSVTCCGRFCTGIGVGCEMTLRTSIVPMCTRVS